MTLTIAQPKKNFEQHGAPGAEQERPDDWVLSQRHECPTPNVTHFFEQFAGRFGIASGLVIRTQALEGIHFFGKAAGFPTLGVACSALQNEDAKGAKNEVDAKDSNQLRRPWPVVPNPMTGDEQQAEHYKWVVDQWFEAVSQVRDEFDVDPFVQIFEINMPVVS